MGDTRGLEDGEQVLAVVPPRSNNESTVGDAPGMCNVGPGDHP